MGIKTAIFLLVEVANEFSWWLVTGQGHRNRLRLDLRSHRGDQKRDHIQCVLGTVTENLSEAATRDT
jgi:hypothetical protein